MIEFQNFNTHSFSPYLAEKYGWKDAVFLQHIYYWIKHNKSKGANFRDGNWWTYNTQKGFAEYFRYLTRDDIRGVIERLEKKKILLTGNYNKISFDKTTWYSLTEFGWQLFGDTIGEFPQSKGDNPKSTGDETDSSGLDTKSKDDNSPNNTNSKTSLNNSKTSLSLNNKPNSLEEVENFWKELRERESYKFGFECENFFNWCVDEDDLKFSWKNILKKWAKKPENQISTVKKSLSVPEDPKISDLRHKISISLPRYRNIWLFAKVVENDGKFTIISSLEKEVIEIRRNHGKKLEDLNIELQIK